MRTDEKFRNHRPRMTPHRLIGAPSQGQMGRPGIGAGMTQIARRDDTGRRASLVIMRRGASLRVDQGVFTGIRLALPYSHLGGHLGGIEAMHPGVSLAGCASGDGVTQTQARHLYRFCGGSGPQRKPYGGGRGRGLRWRLRAAAGAPEGLQAHGRQLDSVGDPLRLCWVPRLQLAEAEKLKLTRRLTICPRNVREISSNRVM